MSILGEFARLRSQTASCAICSEAFSEDGGSAQPLAEGRCCDKCHWTKVARARLARLTKLRCPKPLPGRPASGPRLPDAHLRRR